MTTRGSEASPPLTRIPEPELMEEDQQARAYAEADFEAPHNQFVQQLQAALPQLPATGTALDLGCGPADITLRLARALPHWSMEGWDASEAMLKYGYRAVEQAGLQHRIILKKVHIPQRDPDRETHTYPLIFSNSLLHHLADPMVLWSEIRHLATGGTSVFVMDLMRPGSRDIATCFVDRYAQDEPEVLRRDFFNSLLAAYRVEEVEAQLQIMGLKELQVRAVSDRHLIVWGQL